MTNTNAKELPAEIRQMVNIVPSRFSRNDRQNLA